MFTDCPESHNVITAPSRCHQQVCNGMSAKRWRLSSSLFINGDPEAHPAIVTCPDLADPLLVDSANSLSARLSNRDEEKIKEA